MEWSIRLLLYFLRPLGHILLGLIGPPPYQHLGPQLFPLDPTIQLQYLHRILHGLVDLFLRELPPFLHLRILHHPRRPEHMPSNPFGVHLREHLQGVFVVVFVEVVDFARQIADGELHGEEGAADLLQGVGLDERPLLDGFYVGGRVQ